MSSITTGYWLFSRKKRAGSTGLKVWKKNGGVSWFGPGTLVQPARLATFPFAWSRKFTRLVLQNTETDVEPPRISRRATAIPSEISEVLPLASVAVAVMKPSVAGAGIVTEKFALPDES